MHASVCTSKECATYACVRRPSPPSTRPPPTSTKPGARARAGACLPASQPNAAWRQARPVRKTLAARRVQLREVRGDGFQHLRVGVPPGQRRALILEEPHVAGCEVGAAIPGGARRLVMVELRVTQEGSEEDKQQQMGSSIFPSDSMIQSIKSTLFKAAKPSDMFDPMNKG